ncbi:hypothetical protein [Gracilibacillus sp. YIM 98692]|uniref:hypothetical protein n=1 Tax=Gracilibacillus sp. YIM 98692 TaxID=2663532 RepID=UPI0013D3DD26|nr:hypothetical protein [Gracilibacillus sp. YIM 98692]
MDPFLVTMTWIIVAGAIVVGLTTFIAHKKGLNYKWYGFFAMVLTSIALGFHFGINLMNDLLGGLVVSIVFTVFLGGQWLFLLRKREKYHSRKN